MCEEKVLLIRNLTHSSGQIPYCRTRTCSPCGRCGCPGGWALCTSGWTLGHTPETYTMKGKINVYQTLIHGCLQECQEGHLLPLETCYSPVHTYLKIITKQGIKSSEHVHPPWRVVLQCESSCVSSAVMVWWSFCHTHDICSQTWSGQRFSSLV